MNIPNAEKIRAAKEQRRKARAQRDYIPLDADEENEAEVGDRAQDESEKERCSDDELDDHERRIQFAPKSKTLKERMTEKMGKNWKVEGFFFCFFSLSFLSSFDPKKKSNLIT